MNEQKKKLIEKENKKKMVKKSREIYYFLMKEIRSELLLAKLRNIKSSNKMQKQFKFNIILYHYE